MKAVVTTDKRGVFFGSVTAHDIAKGTATIEDAQMCVYWSADVRGVVGLAATGPTTNCRITKPCPSMELSGVTSILRASDDAAKAWEACPWKS